MRTCVNNAWEWCRSRAQPTRPSGPGESDQGLDYNVSFTDRVTTNCQDTATTFFRAQASAATQPRTCFTCVR